MMIPRWWWWPQWVPHTINTKSFPGMETASRPQRNLCTSAVISILVPRYRWWRWSLIVIIAAAVSIADQRVILPEDDNVGVWCDALGPQPSARYKSLIVIIATAVSMMVPRWWWRRAAGSMKIPRWWWWLLWVSSTISVNGFHGTATAKGPQRNSSTIAVVSIIVPWYRWWRWSFIVIIAAAVSIMIPIW